MLGLFEKRAIFKATGYKKHSYFMMTFFLKCRSQWLILAADNLIFSPCQGNYSALILDIE